MADALQGVQILFVAHAFDGDNLFGSGFVRDPFPGNIIPSGRLDPVAQNVLKYYPLPNRAASDPIRPVAAALRNSGSGKYVPASSALVWSRSMARCEMRKS